MSGFSKNAKNIIFKDFKDEVRKNINSVNYTQEVKKDIKALDVYDSGLTFDKSKGYIKEQPRQFKIILETPKSVTNDGIFYPIFPFFGLGTSRKYGPRKWFDFTILRLEKYFGVKFKRK